ncbi:hypothetical protein ElyMa_005680600 [Elysia marginata]|uniref:Uncharacterized protein n=1 Tax=Elysia marginata TaxID=1093978 RepID=A0AAV4FE50_9GAST|nr:hypothetical protein ElyMa_005680600 [Elysia marginata]
MQPHQMNIAQQFQRQMQPHQMKIARQFQQQVQPHQMKIAQQFQQQVQPHQMQIAQQFQQQMQPHQMQVVQHPLTTLPQQQSQQISVTSGAYLPSIIGTLTQHQPNLDIQLIPDINHHQSQQQHGKLQQQKQPQQQQQPNSIQSNVFQTHGTWLQQQYRNSQIPTGRTVPQQPWVGAITQQLFPVNSAALPILQQQQQPSYLQQISASQNYAPSAIVTASATVQRPNQQHNFAQPIPAINKHGTAEAYKSAPNTAETGFKNQNQLLDSTVNSIPVYSLNGHFDTSRPEINTLTTHNHRDNTQLFNTKLKKLGTDPKTEHHLLDGQLSKEGDSKIASLKTRSTIFKVASNIRQAVDRSSSITDSRRQQGSAEDGSAQEAVTIPTDLPSIQAVTISQEQLQKLSLIIVSVLKLQYPNSVSLPEPVDVAAAVVNSPALLSPLLTPHVMGNPRSRPVRSALGLEAVDKMSTPGASSKENSIAGSPSLLTLLLSPFSSSVLSSPWHHKNLLHNRSLELQRHQSKNQRSIENMLPDVERRDLQNSLPTSKPANDTLMSAVSGPRKSSPTETSSTGVRRLVKSDETRLQTLLDQVRRLQLKEQAQLAERGRQLRQQQDLLLAQQGASLNKQQKQLQAFQKQLEQQQQIYKENIVNRMGTDIIRSIIREEINGPTGIARLSHQTNGPEIAGVQGVATTGRFAASSSNSAFVDVGLFGHNIDQESPAASGLSPIKFNVNRNSVGPRVSDLTGTDGGANSLDLSVSNNPTNDPLDPLGLGGIDRYRTKLSRASINEMSLPSLADREGKERGDLIENEASINAKPSRFSLSSSSSSLSSFPSSPSLYSTLSSSSSSSASSSSPLSSTASRILSTNATSSSSSSSYPLWSPASQLSSTSAKSSSISSSYLLSSAASEQLDTDAASSTYPLSSPASRIPGTGTTSSARVAEGSRGIASSWSVVMQPSTLANRLNSGNRRRPILSTRAQPRSFVRGTGLDKSRRHYNSNLGHIFPQSSSNNPLGLNQNQAVRYSSAAEKGPTQDDTSYITYPVRSRYTSTDYQGKGNHATTSTLNSPEESSLGVPKLFPYVDLATSTPPLWKSKSLLENDSKTATRTGADFSRSHYLGDQNEQDLRHQQQQHYLRHHLNHQQQLQGLRYQHPEHLQLQRRHHEQRRHLFGSHQQRHKLQGRYQHLTQQHGSQAVQRRSQKRLQNKRYLQHQNTFIAKPNTDLTKKVVDGIEVRATPSKPLNPGGPLRIGLDINVRHGVYPIETLKQS